MQHSTHSVKNIRRSSEVQCVSRKALMAGRITNCGMIIDGVENQYKAGLINAVLVSKQHHSQSEICSPVHFGKHITKGSGISRSAISFLSFFRAHSQST